MNDASVCYSRRCVHYALSSVQCVCMCVCVCMRVCIVFLTSTRVKGLETNVCAFIKHPTLLYMEGVWGQA